MQTQQIVPMQTQPNDIAFNFYATLLDSFTDYLNSDDIWNRYWGNSANPPHQPEEFKRVQFQSLIDKINRVPFDSEAADKGTAFNEVVDCMVEHRKPSKKFTIERIVEPDVTVRVSGGQVDCEPAERWADCEYVPNPKAGEVTGIKVQYNNRTFEFDIALCREFADYYKGALTQQFTSGILPTAYGNVKLYGYIDELMPSSVHDIKSTGSYSFGKFKNHWQHIVYPFCLNQNGVPIRDFEYNIVLLPKYGKWETFTEHYSFIPERDIPLLRTHCEDLVRFLIDNRHLIKDEKIFNYRKFVA